MISSSRHRRRGIGSNATIDLTPMVDVVFLLIIFFMLTTTFITVESGLPVDLPEAQTATSSPSELPTVTINGLGELFFGGAQVTEAELPAMVRQALQSSGQTSVVLRADSSAQHGQAVPVMDILRQAGAERIVIATGGRAKTDGDVRGQAVPPRQGQAARGAAVSVPAPGRRAAHRLGGLAATAGADPHVHRHRRGHTCLRGGVHGGRHRRGPYGADSGAAGRLHGGRRPAGHERATGADHGGRDPDRYRAAACATGAACGDGRSRANTRGAGGGDPAATAAPGDGRRGPSTPR